MRTHTIKILLALLLTVSAVTAQAQKNVPKAPFDIVLENSRFLGVYDSPQAVQVALRVRNNQPMESTMPVRWELRRLPSGEVLDKGQITLTSPSGETSWTVLPFPKGAGYGLYEYTARSPDGKIHTESARAAVMRQPPGDREMDNLGFNIHVVGTGNALALRRLGVRWARIDFNWNFTTSRDGIPWGFFDKQVDIGDFYGLKLLPNLCYIPKWAEKPDGLFDPKDHADYVSKILTRYKGRLPAFDIWNEPPESMNKIWADDCKAVYEAARAADPNCKVTGLSVAANPGNPGGFFELLLPPASIGKYLDVFVWNNYPCPRNRRPEDTDKVGSVEELETWLPKIRDLTAGREVWSTEHGYSTCSEKTTDPKSPISPFIVTEKQQGDYIVRQLLLEFAYGLDRVFLYQLGADGDNFDDPEAQWGVTRNRDNGTSAKVAYVQIGNLVRELAGAKPVGVEKPAPDYRVARFRRGDVDVVAAWKIRDSGKLTFRVEKGYVSDPFGNRTPADGTVTLDISESPVFLVSRHVERVP
ncbi:MAG: hypothetical protein JXA11_03270 [Phycisphaerae bacterium]|nr:hypothetical protein [Phycisphaerae bacterium]